MVSLRVAARGVSAGIVAMVCPLWAITQSPPPRFDVAAVRPAGTGGELIGFTEGSAAHLFRREKVTVADLVQFAYSITEVELRGGPDWIRTELFDVTAGATQAFSDGEVRLMVQSLLAEWFALRLRSEMRDTVHYLLRAPVGKLGLRFRRCNQRNDPPAPVPLRLPPGTVPIVGRCLSMEAIARQATATVGVPVIDRSGLTGLWAYEVALEQPGENEPVGPLLAAAFRSQLGLILEPATGLLPVMVVQSVGRLQGLK